jgi:hypothetical protein
MNERIEKLWSQAGGHLSQGNQHGWPHYIIDDPEKFAELIEQDVIERLKTKKNSRYTDIVSDGGMDPRS